MTILSSHRDVPSWVHARSSRRNVTYSVRRLWGGRISAVIRPIGAATLAVAWIAVAHGNTVDSRKGINPPLAAGHRSI